MLLVVTLNKCVASNILQKSLRFQHNQTRFRNFKKYWNPKLVNELLNEDKLIEGRLIFTAGNTAFVINPTDGKKILIFAKSINRALPNDIVAVKLRSVLDWRVRAFLNEPLSEPINCSPYIKPIVPSECEEDLSDTTVDTNLHDESNGNSILPTAPTSHFQLNTDNTFSSASTWPKLSEFFSKSPHLLPDLFPEKNFSELMTGDEMLSSLQKLATLKYPSSPHLVRTGSVVLILRRDLASRRIIGCLSFEPTAALPSVFISSEESSEYVKQHIGQSEARNCKPVTSNYCCFMMPERPNLPKVKLAYSSIPEDLWNQPHKTKGVRYVCQIQDWCFNSMYPHGILLDKIGDQLEIEPATKSLLISHGIREDEFTSEMLSSLPKSEEDFSIPKIEYRRRTDFRSNCVFSVDPSTAKDVDDALHICRCDSNTFKVGIHIADVSYFVRPGSPIDGEAAERTTSVYLVQRVIPMLPPILSEVLCSLNPGKERLTFSVVLTINEDGQIVDEWFGRSIIRSCAKLSYENANELLETSHENLPTLHSRIAPFPPFTLANIKKSIGYLNMLAQKMRQKRIESGALLLDKVELQFNLAPQDQNLHESNQSSDTPPNWPRGYQVKQRGAMHHMIEELMLAANQAVARKLYADSIITHDSLGDKSEKEVVFEQPELSPSSSISTKVGRRIPLSYLPQTKSLGSLLRRHPPPKSQKMAELVSIAEAASITMDTSSAGLIRSSIKAYTDSLQAKGVSEDEVNSLSTALSYLTYMRMQMALYFDLDDIITRAFRCSQSPSSTISEFLSSFESSLLSFSHHFGLNVPLYTHFTSPIRRYADLLVHRKLSTILNTDSWSYFVPKSAIVAQLETPKKLTSTRPLLTSRRLTVQAASCNKMRQETRRLQEENQNLFLAAFIKESGSIVEKGVILEYGDAKVKVLIPSCGLIVNSNLSKFCSSAASWEFIGDEISSPDHKTTLSVSSVCSPVTEKSIEHKKPKLLVKWNADSNLDESNSSLFSVFSLCSCRLSCSSSGFFVKAELLPPNEYEPNHSRRHCSTG